MAPPTNDDEPKFRFVVKIMPPRRPANSLLKRLQQPNVEEPLHIIAVPARASETFADVWKHIKERYECNYTAEEVAQGWFHKLQDRHGADIDSHDGVGELGFTTETPREDLVLIMLQNGIDRDGSVPDTSGLRPPGFSRPELSVEQQQEAKRRRDQEERYGAPLEDVDEDTPIESRERSLGPGSPDLGAQDDGDDGHKIDADGFAVPLLPGSMSRKRKRPRTTRSDVVPSSMEGENDEDILVQDSQTPRNSEKSVSDILPTNNHSSRARIMHSVPADANAGASTSSARAKRARTTAPGAYEENQGPLKVQRLAALQATISKPATSEDGTTKPQPRSPPTPVSATSQPFTQQPPESAQRPKPTPPLAFTPVNPNGQLQLTTNRDAPEDSLDFDPIEDDDLLQGIAGTANDDQDGTELVPGPPFQAPVNSTPASAKLNSKSGKLPRPNKTLTFTPISGASNSKKPASTPANNALERLSGTQGSGGKNPRSQSEFRGYWTSEEDGFLLQGIRGGLSASETAKRFGIEGRTPSAVRGRRALLIKQNPGVEKVAREASADGDKSGTPAAKRRVWSVEEKQIISRAIADGFDALEIHAKHFPGRSEDSMNRIVLSLQDQAWKVASRDNLFPKNGAQLPGWTPKDSCKLKRTYFEGLPAMVAKKRYFGRWTKEEVQRQLDAYSAQIKNLEDDQVRATAGSALKKAVFGSSQLPIDSSQLLVNSSPVERSMQARAARRSPVDAQQRSTIHVPSSPPQPQPQPQATTTELSPLQAQTDHHPTDKGQKSSSPTVDITAIEQDTAREKLYVIEQDASQNPVSRPSSGSGKQSTLNFTRDKGKQRAGVPRPTSEELDAQYTRRPASSSIGRPVTQPQQSRKTSVAQAHTSIEDEDVGSDDQHTPADDLEMLDAELEREHSSIHGEEDVFVSEAKPATGHEARREASTNEKAVSQSPFVSGGRRQSSSTAMTMQSPMTTSSTSSGRRRRSRVESGVDTRVAAQLSQELNRSLSREAREEAAHEDQVFHTPDPKINRYHRASRPSTAKSPEDIETQIDNDFTEGSRSFRTQGFRAQDPITTSQRRPRVSFQADQSPRTTEPGTNSARKAPSLQPSPQIGSSNSGGTRTTTPATTPAKPGKLPSRGQSYASRIKDIHRPAQSATNTAAKPPSPSPKEGPANDTTEQVRDNLSPPPTDADIWAKTANAESLGRDRQEYFEDLKISTFSIRAMGCGDWEEVTRLKAEERRLHRQRKIARGVYVPSARDTQHPDGPAQAGDAEQADEEVIRADDVSGASSEIEEDFDEKIWSDGDFEQAAEVDHERHFSEVEDDEMLDGNNAQVTKAIEEPQDDDRSRQVSEVNADEEMLDPVDRVHETAQANAADVVGEHEEHVDELDLPTVHTLPETNDLRHGPTNENLQELDNSGAEGSPIRIASRKHKSDKDESSPKSRPDKQLPDDRAVMPPPPSTNVKVSKRMKRRKRLSSSHHAGKSGSERSSSFSHQHPSSDAPQQHAPSTPARPESTAHRSKRAKVSETTPAKKSPKASRSQTQQSTAGGQKTPSTKANQRTIGGGMSGLSGLVRKAHIPTPPKAKRTPPKGKQKKLDIRAENDESDESSDSN